MIDSILLFLSPPTKKTAKPRSYRYNYSPLERERESQNMLLHVQQQHHRLYFSLFLIVLAGTTRSARSFTAAHPFGSSRSSLQLRPGSSTPSATRIHHPHLSSLSCPLSRGITPFLLSLQASIAPETPDETTTRTTFVAANDEQQQQQQQQLVGHAHDEEKWELESKVVELVLLVAWMASISVFILINNFVGPWPAAVMTQVHERIWFTLHMLGGMLFGGGVILTTAIELMVAKNKNESVLSFWFDKVPLLDAAIVLPGLTLAMISGTGLTVKHYGGLGLAPQHIQIVFYTLVAFAAWWAATDLTTQGSALTAVNEWAASAGTNNSSQDNNDDSNNNETREVPKIVDHRTISNVVSCLFVLALYTIMVMKPGTIHY